MFYLIRGYDSMYQGLHGLDDWTVEWCENEEEANDIGCHLSEGVINSHYSVYQDDIDENIAEIMGIDLNELDYHNIPDEVYHEAFNELIAYRTYPLNISCIDDIPPDMDWDEILRNFSD